MRLVIHAFLVSLFLLTAYDVEASENDPVEISVYQEDVTGDGELETIELYGIHFSSDSVYYRDIYTIVTSADNEWRINYQGGYDPVIELVDLNHDGVNDIFYQSPTGGSGGLYTSRLDTLANGELINIPLPEQEYVKGYFEDGFQAIVEIAPTSKPIVLNVEDRKVDYIRMGIFDEGGKLIKPTKLIIDPIAFFEPIEISKKQGYGLKSYKQVSGAYHANQLGVIETVWYYENGKWIAKQIDWKDSGEQGASSF